VLGGARRLLLLVVLPIVLGAGVLAAVPVDGPGAPAAPAAAPVPEPALEPAADTSAFRPGNIITDAVFYDSGAMTVTQIQAFLNSEGASCRQASGQPPCLKNYRQTTQTQPASSYCPRQYTGAANETAAAIIAKVAVACGINPRVLLVMLQKETGLVTRTGPTAHLYNRAMGFGCPDNAGGACSAVYPGFFKQVYFASRQFKLYQAKPTGYGHVPGIVNNVRFHPNAACGSSPVRIENQATAGLYNYTPYQPNAAALAAGYAASSNSCSSYGNRNFWLYFTDWFGSTQTPGRDVDAPTGNLDSVGAGSSSIIVSGWTFDPNAKTSSIDVHVYVDGRFMKAIRANGTRRDVGAAFPGVGPFHGYSGSVIAAPGRRTVCVYAVTTGPGYSNPRLGCRAVTVPAFPASVPVGGLDTVSVVGQTVTAADPRPDAAAVYPRARAAHGFTWSATLAGGQHEICAYAINLGAGRANPRVGCQTVVVGGSPMGGFEEVEASPSQVRVTGWALDPDTAAPIDIQVKAGDLVSSLLPADADRPEVDTFRPGYGAAHGFDVTVPASGGGDRVVCVYAANTGSGANVRLGCRTVNVPSSPPIGNVDTQTLAGTTLTLAGWALDKDEMTEPVQVRVQVNGVTRTYTWTRTRRADIPAAFPGAGPNQGWALAVPLSPGANKVCAYGVDRPGTAGSGLLGTCSNWTVP
jgi:hypothetical protein